jgi:tripartite-type tricarboxylate transporter receptor subunit TctC
MPPLSEAVSGYQAAITVTYGLIGPKGLRADALRRWNAELNKFIESRDMKERLAKDGIEPVGGAPSVFQEVIRRDVEQWRRVVKEARLSFTS